MHFSAHAIDRFNDRVTKQELCGRTIAQVFASARRDARAQIHVKGGRYAKVADGTIVFVVDPDPLVGVMTVYRIEAIADQHERNRRNKEHIRQRDERKRRKRKPNRGSRRRS